MLSKYDTWKTNDWKGENQQEVYERAIELIESNGCEECGNNDANKFENIVTDIYYEGKHACLKVEAECNECESICTWSIEPDCR
jgi:hypothetical protein